MKKAGFQNKNKSCNTCEYVNVCPCMCYAGMNAWKGFNQGVNGGGVSGNFYSFCIFLYCLSFLHVHLLFYIFKNNMVVLIWKNEKQRRGVGRRKKREERKQDHCGADRLFKDQPSEFTHLGSEIWQECHQSCITLFFAMIRLSSFLIILRARSACQG